MTDVTDRLDALQAQLDAATPGPWAVMDVNDPGEGVNFIDIYAETDGLETVCRMPNPADYSWRDYLQADAEFIAASPENTRFLLDLARKQQAALDAVRALVYDDTLSDGLVMHVINTGAIRAALDAPDA